MRDATRPRPGCFCWPELATNDPAAARAFYGDLFGWTFRDAPATPGGSYTVCQLGPKDAAALSPLAEARGKHGGPQWNSYVAVPSADAAAARAGELGGDVVVAPSDVGTNGRMAVVRDPQGAVLSLWEAKAHPGIGVEGEIGSLCWTELVTKDVALARLFYGRLFGWTFKRSESDGSAGYTEIVVGGKFLGGILALEKGGPSPQPAWSPYFRVADCDLTVSEVKARGGRVSAGPSDLPNMGRFALLADPQGATFAVISFEAIA